VLRSFADIPPEIRRRVDAGERVALILLDALGLELLRRHDDHPLVRRLAITPLATQLPSTTTAHVTTIHFGVPVHEHGLYEWNVLEPALGEVICPLRFTFAGAESADGLAGRLDPAVLAPGPTFYETLGAPAFVFQPAAIADSTFTRLATAGASTHGFETFADGLAMLTDSLDGGRAPAYALLYWDAIDRTGHEEGPGSASFHAAARAALDDLAERLGELRGVTVLLCADHGQVDVSPDRVDYLDDLWPQLPAELAHPRPAGSSRDVFLHVREGRTGAVIDGLSARLGDRARVAPATTLFAEIGPRLRERLGDVVVLPAPGRQAWLRSAAANERFWLGQHGGLDPAETATYLAEVVAG
jgi:predicted AlkP superfamily pyrophosphatase or phosphodiesterase